MTGHDRHRSVAPPPIAVLRYTHALAPYFARRAFPPTTRSLAHPGIHAAVAVPCPFTGKSFPPRSLARSWAGSPHRERLPTCAASRSHPTHAMPVHGQESNHPPCPFATLPRKSRQTPRKSASSQKKRQKRQSAPLKSRMPRTRTTPAVTRKKSHVQRNSGHKWPTPHPPHCGLWPALHPFRHSCRSTRALPINGQESDHHPTPPRHKKSHVQQNSGHKRPHLQNAR